MEGRHSLPPACRRLLALLLIVGLTAVTAYAGCRQLHATSSAAARPSDRIEAVDAIHAYVRRVERALRLTDEPSEDRAGRLGGER
jgi:hypothetical protein